jgi:hypothetical protein
MICLKIRLVDDMKMGLARCQGKPYSFSCVMP